MLSVCSVIGVALVLPKRKEQSGTEEKIAIAEKKEEILGSIKDDDVIQ